MKMTTSSGDDVDENQLTNNGNSLPHPDAMKNFSTSETVDGDDFMEDTTSKGRGLLSPLHSKSVTPREEHDLFLDEEDGIHTSINEDITGLKRFNDNDDDDSSRDVHKNTNSRDMLLLTSPSGRYTWRCYLLIVALFVIFLGMLIPLTQKQEKKVVKLQQENQNLKAQLETANEEIDMLDNAYLAAEKQNGYTSDVDDYEYYYGDLESDDDDSPSPTKDELGDYDYEYEFTGKGTGETYSGELGNSKEFVSPTPAPAPIIKGPTTTYAPTYYPTDMVISSDDDTDITSLDDYDYDYELTDGAGNGETHSDELGLSMVDGVTEATLDDYDYEFIGEGTGEIYSGELGNSKGFVSPTPAPAPIIKGPTTTYAPTYYPTDMVISSDDDTDITLLDDYDYDYELTDGAGNGETHSDELGLTKVDGVYVGGYVPPTPAP